MGDMVLDIERLSVDDHIQIQFAASDSDAPLVALRLKRPLIVGLSSQVS